MKRGGTLIAIKTADDKAHMAAEILGRHGAVNIDERAEAYSKPYDAAAAPISAPKPLTQPVAKPAYDVAPKATVQTGFVNTGTQTNAINTDKEVVLPVIEEELQVGKRAVETGGVRVYSHVTETPVQEQVQLHEEHVSVERHPVNRPLTGADATAFKEENFELREMSEQAVISKQARVVEEVVVGKTASDRTETVQDTVRRTDVQVEQLGAQHSPRTGTFMDHESDFRSNYNRTYGSSGMNYEQFAPAYQHGYGLANDPRYRGRDWASAQSDIQRDWEAKQPGTWSKFSNAVRYAWDQATGAERGGIQTGGRTMDGAPDTRGITEKVADTVTGDRIDDKTGRPVL